VKKRKAASLQWGGLFYKMNDELEILAGLVSRDILVLKRLVYDHSENMMDQAYFILQDTKKAIEIVDNILFKLWNEAGYYTASLPLNVFLYEEVRKACERAV
jgi:hypothetical protein